jgi:adenine-specific DNA-methyltransferase
LDPQLVWRGKDEQDWSDLVVNAPPLYIQEKVHPKALIDDLLRESKERRHESGELMADLFSDFNGIPKGVDRTDFYQHDQNWSNRLILGDSLQVMASLAEREGLRGRVQCIYLDPPYGIKFNSNFQWSTTSRDVRDGNVAQITREPEQVRAFRDTWRDGIHSYLTYLRDRLLVARDLLDESGSIFVQIGDENVHRVRALLDEVFGPEQFAALITFRKKMMPLGSDVAEGVSDYLVWYARNRKAIKTRPLFYTKAASADEGWSHAILPDGRRVALSKTELTADAGVYQAISLLPAQYRKNQDFAIDFEGRSWPPPKSSSWKTDRSGMERLLKANRLHPSASTLRYVLRHADYPVGRITNLWSDASAATQQVYVVQTNVDVVKRCILMTTDPGDLVLDPTCGSGTTATVAEQWGRRWITIDTSRVALALARARIMGSRFPFFMLADSRDGQIKEAEASRTAPSSQSTHGDIRQGFVYERVPHVTLGAIANNAEIDVVWEKWQTLLESLRAAINGGLKTTWAEWEIPREHDSKWPASVGEAHARWWDARVARQKEIDASIAAKAEFERLYDKPYEDKKKVRVAGPFTVESLSPHRVLGVDENDELLDHVSGPTRGYEPKRTFPQMIVENLRTAGVQQAHKEDRIKFTSLEAWPGTLIAAEGRYIEGGKDGGPTRRAAIFIGPEFGTVTRLDLIDAVKEAADAKFDVLIACAFNYDAHTTDFAKVGSMTVLKARMNADLHMAEDLKNTGKGNLFVVFGEPDIEIITEKDGRLRVKVKGVDVFHPSTGEVRSDGPDGIACWFIDTDYNGESFFVRHAYFLGANDPYSALKTTLKAEIDPEAWATLNRDTSRAFEKPKSGRIAVKVINHLGDEVMKVFRT